MGTLLLEALILSFVINISMFLIAYKLRSDKLTDISYAVTFIVIVFVLFIQYPRTIEHVLLLAMILLWATRLGGFLLFRIMKTGKDKRFDAIRDDFSKFGLFWLGQALSVWALTIPIVLAFGARTDFSWLGFTGVCVWFVGVAIESVADFQKYSFSQRADNKNKWIESGIWHYSRHPNYFGEILVWIGVYMFCVPFLSLTPALIGLVSPLFITTLLLFVSGIPPLEKSADTRWGVIPAYRRYKAGTSILIPFPVRKDNLK